MNWLAFIFAALLGYNVLHELDQSRRLDQAREAIRQERQDAEQEAWEIPVPYKIEVVELTCDTVRVEWDNLAVVPYDGLNWRVYLAAAEDDDDPTWVPEEGGSEWWFVGEQVADAHAFTIRIKDGWAPSRSFIVMVAGYDVELGRQSMVGTIARFVLPRCGREL